MISGPPVFLQPETAQIIALVLHELATNAAKYGALSQLKGKVALSWQWQQGELDLQWEESGGPSVQAPVTKGYGTKVITASVIQQLGGTATFDWRPSGLKFAMSTTIGDRPAAAPQKPTRAPAPNRQAANQRLDAARRSGSASFWSRTKRSSA